MLIKWRAWLAHALNPVCPGCQQALAGDHLCLVCQSFLTPLPLPCPCCGEPNSNGHRCGRCLKYPSRWDRLYAPWPFEFLARHLILEFKYRRNFAAGQALVRLWHSNVGAVDLPDAFAFAPMTHAKQMKRGYNQAQWLCRSFSKSFNRPVFSGLQKKHDTQPLEGLTKKERKRVLKDSFQVLSPPPKHIAIIDDVFTSGATANELARILKKAGAARVDIWVLARTPLQGKSML